MTFRTRLFRHLAGRRRRSRCIVATPLVSWSVRRRPWTPANRAGLVNEARLAAETLSHRQRRHAASSSTPRRTRSARWSARASPSSPPTAPWSATRSSTPPAAASAREPRRPARRSVAGAGRRAGHRPALQHDAQHRHALRGGAGAEPGRAADLAVVRLALPLTEHQPAARRGAASRADRLRRRPARRAGAGLGVSALLEPPRLQAIAAVARALRGRRSLATRRATTATTSSASWRGRWTTRSGSSASRAVDLETDRARMEAILGGMIEGVLVVNDQGRRAAGQRRGAADAAAPGGTVEGRHYLEIVRHPDVAAQLGATLGGSDDRRSRAGAAARVRIAASSRAARRSAPRPPAARCWCCTTSPSCARPTGSAATSSPTCRTSCARR